MSRTIRANAKARRTFSNTAAAIDLASIMVGVIVIGVISGIVAVAVFAVIPWAQDEAAKSDISSVNTAEAVSKTADGRFSTGDRLVDMEWLTQSSSVGAATDADGTCFVAAARSRSGNLFFGTASKPAPMRLTESTVPGCIDADALDKLVEGIGGWGDEIPVKLAAAHLADGKKNLSYTAVIPFENGTSGRLTVSGGNLPAGLSLNDNTGKITGTPTAEGIFPFTVEAKNGGGSDSRQYSITVGLVAPEITTGTLPAAFKGASYSNTIEFTGESTTLAVSLGNLPDGLGLNGDTGVVSGVPTASGEFDFTVAAVNSGGISALAYTVKVSIVAPTISTAGLPQAARGTGYSAPVVFTGEGVVLSVSLGELPVGLVLDPATGFVSGTPTSVGVYDFTVVATNAGGAAAQALSITVELSAPAFTASTLSNAIVGTPYSAAVAATGESVVYAVSLGRLPTGLSLNGSTGAITGTPTAASTESFTITASNTGGSAAVATSIEVMAPAPTIVDAALPGAVRDRAYSAVITATGSGVTYAKSGGTLPTGMTLSAAGVISGTPSSSVAGMSTFTVTAQNATGSASATFTIFLAQPPTISTASILTVVVGKPATRAFAGTPADATWAAAGMPAGTTMSAAGVISGTPTVAGTYSVVVTATNAYASTSKTLTWVIGGPTLANAGFEAGLTGWTATGGATVSSTVAKTGSNSLSMPVGASVSQTIPANWGNNFTQVDVAVYGPGFRVTVEQFNSAGVLITPVLTGDRNAAAGAWATFPLAVAPRTGAVTATITITKIGTGVGYLDDVSWVVS